MVRFMRIGFMGSPDFVINTLDKLIKSEHDVVCVHTRMPKPAGRGKNIMKTAIHEFAESNQIVVRAVKTLRSEEEKEYIKSLNLDIIVVAAYGLIIPQEVLDMPRFGCINIHPSLLPRWRGAAPVHWAILSGDKKTGVCIMKLVQALDAGDVYKCIETEIGNMTTPELTEKLFNIGSEALIDVINGLETGKSTAIPQSKEGLTYAEKVEKVLINWEDNIEIIERKIRALAMHPGIFINFNNEKMRIYKADYDLMSHDFENGVIMNDDFHIACSGGVLKPKIVQRPGKKALDISDFMRGFRSSLKGEILS